MHSVLVQAQRSLSLFHPTLLSELFIKGYSSLVVKLLVKLKLKLEKIDDSTKRVQDYIDHDLESLLLELKSQAETFSLGGSAQPAGKGGKGGNTKKKDNAYSVFDDLEESESPDEEEVKKPNDDSDIDYPKVFKSTIDDFVNLLSSRGAEKLGMEKDEVFSLIEFVLKFHRIF